MQEFFNSLQFTRMAGHADKIYVEIDIHGSLDRLWQLTQTPELHQRWDLRFTQISYLPRPDARREACKIVFVPHAARFGLSVRGQRGIGRRLRWA